MQTGISYPKLPVGNAIYTYKVVNSKSVKRNWQLKIADRVSPTIEATVDFLQRDRFGAASRREERLRRVFSPRRYANDHRLIAQYAAIVLPTYKNIRYFAQSSYHPMSVFPVVCILAGNAMRSPLSSYLHYR